MAEIVRLILKGNQARSSRAAERKRYREFPDLTGNQWQYALTLWRGGLDTWEIADFFDVPEAAIYNGLSRLREGRDLCGV